ncbi:beta-ketoacyl-[acyl-carrier-protein] synthase II [Alphaproteobacteria bacterium 46_93_T64]|nr:beta-ketoacyl-[acyl-carrier-protein] synthase II [Alphaproteobacteria bacterium 46_93_T64]
MTNPLYLNALGIISPLGSGKEATYRAMISGGQSNMIYTDRWTPNSPEYLGIVTEKIEDLPVKDNCFQSRNNRLLNNAANQIDHDICAAVSEFGRNKVGVIVGTSTSGIEESELAMKHRFETGAFPKGYHFGQQEIGSPALFLAKKYGIGGPTYSVSSACASGGKAFAAAARLINLGVCDAVLVGGADSLCSMTIGGFRSLQALSDDICNPMSRNRSGTNIGEGAALFLMSRKKSDVYFLGSGESSDAHHISAPEPNGTGAEVAMRKALQSSEIQADEIRYLNLHGTATALNDSMEAAAISRIFGENLITSSSKPMTGHALGAAGAIEAAMLWLSLENLDERVKVPPHLWDGDTDPDIERLKFSTVGETIRREDRLLMMSNSFAFGGSNVSIILGWGE